MRTYYSTSAQAHCPPVQIRLRLIKLCVRTSIPLELSVARYKCIYFSWNDANQISLKKNMKLRTATLSGQRNNESFQHSSAHAGKTHYFSDRVRQIYFVPRCKLNSKSINL